MADVKKTPVTNPPKNGDKPDNTSKEIPLGNGLAQKAREALKGRGKQLDDAIDGYTK